MDRNSVGFTQNSTKLINLLLKYTISRGSMGGIICDDQDNPFSLRYRLKITKGIVAISIDAIFFLPANLQANELANPLNLLKKR